MALRLGQLIEDVFGCNAIKAGVEGLSPEWYELCLFQQDDVAEITRRLKRGYDLKFGPPVVAD